MSQRTSSAASWLASPPPSVAVEITATRVVAVALDDHGGSYSIAGHAMEPLAAGVATPALNAANVHDEAALTAAVRSVLGSLVGASQACRAGAAGFGRQGLAACASRKCRRNCRISNS